MSQKHYIALHHFLSWYVNFTDPSRLTYGAEIRVETSEQFSDFEVLNSLPGDAGLRALEKPIRGGLFYMVLTAYSLAGSVFIASYLLTYVCSLPMYYILTGS